MRSGETRRRRPPSWRSSTRSRSPAPRRHHPATLREEVAGQGLVAPSTGFSAFRRRPRACLRDRRAPRRRAFARAMDVCSTLGERKSLAKRPDPETSSSASWPIPHPDDDPRRFYRNAHASRRTTSSASSRAYPPARSSSPRSLARRSGSTARACGSRSCSTPTRRWTTRFRSRVCSSGTSSVWSSSRPRHHFPCAPRAWSICGGSTRTRRRTTRCIEIYSSSS